MSKRALSFVSLFALAASACAEAPPPEPMVAPPPPSAPAVPVPPPPAPTTPDADYRKQAPAPGPDVAFVAPKIEEFRLKNGIRVLLVERHDLPIVAVRVASDLGADHGPPGVGAFAGALLTSGTKTKSAIEISDAFHGLGADYGAWVDYDGTYLSAQVISSKLEAGLALLADIAQHPSFPKEEVERERSRRLTSLAQERDSPQRLLGNVVLASIYPPKHPYATPPLGNEAIVGKVKSADLAAFHAATMAPDHLTITIAGDVTKAQAQEQLEKAFGAWKGKLGKVRSSVERKADEVAKLRDACFTGKGACNDLAADVRVVIIDRPNSSQSNVSVAQVGEPRSAADYDALLVMNTLLGGQFSSRLNMNLREGHGRSGEDKTAYTYGAGSRFDMRHGAGPFGAGGAIVRESTGPAIKEILAEIARMRAEAPSDEELDSAKASMIKSLPARFETAGETAGTLAWLGVYALPLDEYATRPARIAKITKDDVLRVAKTHLVPERFRVVVVGEASVIKAQIEALNVGKVEVRPMPKPEDKKVDVPAAPKAPPAPKKK
jgi:predicted Zn-dependent peptidase